MAGAGVREVQFGPRRVDFPSEQLGMLTRSGADEPAELLRDRLARDGYLYVPQLLNREKVLRARQLVLDSFAAKGDVLVDGAPVAAGLLDSRCGVGCVPFMEGQNAITHSSEVLGGVLESDELRQFFDRLFGVPARTFDFKWLRGVPREAFTGAHCDWFGSSGNPSVRQVYMGRGTRQLVTAWVPFGENPVEMGSLAMLEVHKLCDTAAADQKLPQGSHSLAAFSKLRETYGEIDHEQIGLDGTGWFTLDPNEVGQLGGAWKTSDFDAGDVLCFGMHTLHMSTTNVTDKVRISCDVRWQPADEPADPRYVGEIDIDSFAKAGLHNKNDEEPDSADGTSAGSVTMTELKRQWGFEPMQDQLQVQPCSQ